MNNKQKAIVVLGAYWGDEGKRRMVDILANDADIICRFQSGTNAGHVGIEGLNEIIRNDCISLIGNGAVIHLPSLLDEIKKLNTVENVGKMAASAVAVATSGGRFIISDRAHLVFDFHKTVDLLQELERGKNAIGTTGKGMGPAYASKIARHGIRLIDLLEDFEKFSNRFKSLVAIYLRAYDYLRVDIDAELERYKKFAEKIRPYVRNTVEYLHVALAENKKIIIEATNGTMLDVDFGTYPSVTSSNCTIGGVCTGLGIPPNLLGNIYGVVKSYMTRVGIGPFPTEENEIGQFLNKKEGKFGKKTKLIKRYGWLDLVLLKYTTMVNGFNAIALTKLDVLDDLDEIKIGIAYELNNGEKINYFPSSSIQLKTIKVIYKILPGWKKTNGIKNFNDLPENGKNYIKLIEDYLQIPIKWIGVGEENDDMIQIF